jgi:NAD(P)-dependent dehydrogenase (short-subunit alcohol dehydrogenase family)
MLLSGRVAIVGGLTGVGGAVARAFGREGAAVVLGDPSEAALVMIKQEVVDGGGVVRTVTTELADEGDGTRLVQAALDAFGQLDILVCNPHGVDVPERFAAADLDRWRRELDTTLFGSLQLARAAIPPMRAARRGSIVFVSAGVLREPAVQQGARAAAYGALLTASQVLARELGPADIRVNTIVPRPADLASTVGEPASDAAADAVVFLASDLAAVVTGQSLDVRTTSPG